MKFINVNLLLGQAFTQVYFNAVFLPSKSAEVREHVFDKVVAKGALKRTYISQPCDCKTTW